MPTGCLALAQRLLRRWDLILGSVASYLRWDTGEAEQPPLSAFSFPPCRHLKPAATPAGREKKGGKQRCGERGRRNGAALLTGGTAHGQGQRPPCVQKRFLVTRALLPRDLSDEYIKTGRNTAKSIISFQ